MSATAGSAAIVRLLRDGGFVSGEAIARALGVTRAAVAKQVELLRGRGWRISARPRRGYRLDAAPDLLEAAAVAPLLATRWLGRDWRWHESLASTNDAARTLAEAGAAHGTVVVAEAQTRGRGRMGRPWHSPPRENVYLSVLLRPAIAPAEAPPVTRAAALAVAEAIEAAGVRGATLKWPNDVRVGGRKLCGILTEMSAEAEAIRFLVLGVGVNVNAAAFPPDLAPIATSIRLALGRPIDRVRFAADLCRRIEGWLDRFFAEGRAPILAAYRERLELGPVRVDTGAGVVEGVAEGVDELGALLVRTSAGALARIVSGDVT